MSIDKEVRRLADKYAENLKARVDQRLEEMESSVLMEIKSQTHIGECLDVLQEMEPESVDLVYVDPPFFTQKVHDLVTRDGSTLVAAQLLNRNSIGIDISEEAIELTRNRLENPVITGSALLEKGRESYRQHSCDASNYLVGIDYMPVHRNKGIDGLLKQEIDGLPAFIRVQRHGENIGQTVAALKKAVKNKGDCTLIVVATCDDLLGYRASPGVYLIQSTSLAITDLLKGRQGSTMTSRSSSENRTIVIDLP